jgi:hypothetical protein
MPQDGLMTRDVKMKPFSCTVLCGQAFEASRAAGNVCTPVDVEVAAEAASHSLPEGSASLERNVFAQEHGCTRC